MEQSWIKCPRYPLPVECSIGAESWGRMVLHQQSKISALVTPMWRGCNRACRLLSCPKQSQIGKQVQGINGGDPGRMYVLASFLCDETMARDDGESYPDGKKDESSLGKEGRRECRLGMRHAALRNSCCKWTLPAAQVLGAWGCGTGKP